MSCVDREHCRIMPRQHADCATSVHSLIVECLSTITLSLYGETKGHKAIITIIMTVKFICDSSYHQDRCIITDFHTMSCNFEYMDSRFQD